MRKFILLITSLLCYSSYSTHAQSLKKMPLGNGIVNFVDQDSTWSVKLSGRMQFLAASRINRYEDGSSDFVSTFSPRRIRFKLGGFVYSPKLHYFLQMGFSEQDMQTLNTNNSEATQMIYDAYMRWNFYKNCEVKFGQFKLPGNVERMISSGNMQFVDRSILNSTMNIDRDLGIMLSHSFNTGYKVLVRDVWAITQGEGRGGSNGSQGGLNYTSRVEVLPLGEFADGGDYKGSSFGLELSPKVLLGLTYNFNNNAIRTNGQLGQYMAADNGFLSTDITNIFFDAVVRYRRYSFLAEYASRNAQTGVLTSNDGSQTYFIPEGNAYNVQAGYLFRTNWEISARYSEVYFNQNNFENNARRLATVAFSRYIVEHKLKWQTDFSSLIYGGGRNSFMARMQFEFQF